jgi:DNA-binding transcriptional regulator YiaG
MTDEDFVKMICDVYSGCESPRRLAKLLNVEYSLLCRWTYGDSLPDAISRESIQIVLASPEANFEL